MTPSLKLFRKLVFSLHSTRDLRIRLNGTESSIAVVSKKSRPIAITATVLRMTSQISFDSKDSEKNVFFKTYSAVLVKASASILSFKST